MEIKNSFVIEAPVDQAWALLTDIPAIAPCMPGATLSGEEHGVYRGAVKIKLGPVTAEYRGSAEFVERDDTKHRAVIDGQGRDSRGAGNARAMITAEMRDLGGTTQVDISTDLKVTGKVAQFGRGVMQDVSEKLLHQFANCLAIQLEGTSGLEAIAAAGAAESVPATSAVTPDENPDQTAAENPDQTAAENPDQTAAENPDQTAAVTPDLTTDDGEAFDLLDIAGGAVFKRALPVAIVALIIVVSLLVII